MNRHEEHRAAMQWSAAQFPDRMEAAGDGQVWPCSFVAMEFIAWMRAHPVGALPTRADIAPAVRERVLRLGDDRDPWWPREDAA